MEQTQLILIVDDDPEFRDGVRELLEGQGFTVVEASDGQAALDFLLTERALVPSLILLDVEMPRMSGWELVAILRGYHRFASIPLVVISGHDYRTDAAKPTVEACFLKPFAPDAFLRAVAELRRGSEPSRRDN